MRDCPAPSKHIPFLCPSPSPVARSHRDSSPVARSRRDSSPVARGRRGSSAQIAAFVPPSNHHSWAAAVLDRRNSVCLRVAVRSRRVDLDLTSIGDPGCTIAGGHILVVAAAAAVAAEA